MPLFMCGKCGCVDNTATSGYWTQQMAHYEANNESIAGFKPLCSLHNPEIGKWHDLFPRKLADGYLADSNGHIYAPKEIARFPDRKLKPVELPEGAAI